MAGFDPKSRYVKHAKTRFAVDRRGRQVACLTPAQVPEQTELGEHRKKDHQRLDHLAHYYLKDASGFWRLAEINDAIVPDALSERPFVRIPARKGGS